MKPIDETEIVSILTPIRNEMELYAKRHHYNESTLGSLCGIASYLVFLKLKELEYGPVFCMNDNHCFVMIGDYYVDLTINQFDKDLPKIYFKKEKVSVQYHRNKI